MRPSSCLTLRQVSVPRRLATISAQVSPGSLIHIIGPNGAGKSTLLACIGGLMPAAGDISLLGRPVAQWHGADLALRRGYLCQQALPYAAMPVFQYLMLHQPHNADEAAVDRTVGYLAAALSLGDKLNRPLNQLSGGEWQRARLTAALLQIWPAVNPLATLLLLDEPAASLDIAQRVALDALLAELTDAGIAVLACAHDLNHTLHHASRVWLMSSGNLAAQGSVGQVMRPDVLSPVFGVDFTLLQAGGRRWLVASGAPSQVVSGAFC
ncbi:vitamin B12 ABC transporter ATP-binding protein BtuD [Acerihabitans arboris]|uniref:Vitamin B12 import ATP-binding protein BtuD n=1 Tax=Acerihabitans arboris TaxID=2691583 RepID=A0A845SKF6_9GAMM|nr:vitamin B12 ABC transporter ATP-binding protein BtuD [Acerihabitans arboris]NDL63068.1 vitamin B12 ABC transporter ATP-binding protein BtuD [Acerihabitans arboris]